MFQFESSVISDGYQTAVRRVLSGLMFESSVISDGYQTASACVKELC